MADVWFVTLKINIKMIFIDFFSKEIYLILTLILTLYYFILLYKN